MNLNKAKLANILPFEENDRWYLKLIYTYEDKIGKHTVVIPKAEVPFIQTSVPYVHIRTPYIDCSDTMTLHEAVCDLASERGAKNPAFCFDIITEYAPREMTLDEIEKELGYKVKIVNEEKNNGNGKEM